MHPLVVVHGAFGGGWEWTPVADRLRADGIRVFTPTLSGLGDRAHVRAADLSMHVADLTGLLEMEDLRDVVLCAASYGGMPATVAASRSQDRLARLVYLDALVPRDRECAADLIPGVPTEELAARVRTEGPDYRLPVPASVLPPVGRAPEEVRQRYVQRLRPHPALSLLEPARLTPVEVPTTFVRCTDLTLGADDPIAAMELRASEAGWDIRELDATHDPHLSNPDAVVALLRELAG
jgi:pimeloyl-ACP methyl ester carboxylesterase